MKITHISLCGPVTDNWSYQDNLLPKYHKMLGYEVSVITSKYIWNEEGNIDFDERDVYFNEYCIKTIRIENKYKTNIKSKFKKYKKLYEAINMEAPDILFVHGVQFLDIKEVVKYKIKHPTTRIYVDNHADFSNSASNFLSKFILHKIIWRYCAKSIEPFTNKFYGVLPARVDFLKNIYKISDEKVELLIMGADDQKVDEAKGPNKRNEIREKYNIKSDDFLIITGGKIDNSKKQTLLLMEAVQYINNKNIKLIVFGSVIKELKKTVNKYSDDDKIQYIGWIDSEDSYKFFAAADLVIFPGRHSVFWEQVVGLGVPLVVKKWEGTSHVDLGGNCEFLHENSSEEIAKMITSIINDKNKYFNMKKIAEGPEHKKFLYSNIARESIENL